MGDCWNISKFRVCPSLSFVFLSSVLSLVPHWKGTKLKSSLYSIQHFNLVKQRKKVAHARMNSMEVQAKIGESDPETFNRARCDYHAQGGPPPRGCENLIFLSLYFVSWRIGRHYLLHRDPFSEGRDLFLRTVKSRLN